MILVNKPVGYTPLQMIQKLKQQPELSAQTLSYAGRLDPMAEGLLVILVGEENKKRHEFEQLEKEYKVEVLFGISTDSYDLLGLITQSKEVSNKKNLIDQIQKVLPEFLGKRTQAYPPFSSKPVQGKPLYYWAKKGKLTDIEIPTKEIQIFRLELLATQDITVDSLSAIVTRRIRSVIGDFRQEEILATWNKFFQTHGNHQFVTMKCKASCSSGTYIRSLVHELGMKLGVPVVTLHIQRTRIGLYMLKNAILL